MEQSNTLAETRWKGGRKMSDLVKKLRDPAFGFPDCFHQAAADEIEAQAAEITRLRAAINDALTAPWPDPELNSTRHQEPIGPNETPEEAIKRLVSVRAEWAVCENDRNNPVIADLRAELATARREGMERAVAILRARHRGLEHIREWRESQHCADEIAAAIRAAAGDEQ
jgi:hypothetical protein